MMGQKKKTKTGSNKQPSVPSHLLNYVLEIDSSSRRCHWKSAGPRFSRPKPVQLRYFTPEHGGQRAHLFTMVRRLVMATYLFPNGFISSISVHFFVDINSATPTERRIWSIASFTCSLIPLERTRHFTPRRSITKDVSGAERTAITTS
jgi:hypothetical protein